MKRNPPCMRNDAAFPYVDDATVDDDDAIVEVGLTKREWFAGMMMQGCAVHLPNAELSARAVAQVAVTIADALIDELNKEQE